MMKGGWVPAGIWRMAVWENEVTCAVAGADVDVGLEEDLDDAQCRAWTGSRICSMSFTLLDRNALIAAPRCGARHVVRRQAANS